MKEKISLHLVISFLFILFFVSCRSDDSEIALRNTVAFRDIKVIAHRGFWKTSGSAQNSIASVRLAGENKMHGVEVDVRMSADSILYLCHDETINGFEISKTNSDILDQQHLSNGENLARFDHFIETASQYKSLYLLIEIKDLNASSQYKKYIVMNIIERLTKANLQHRCSITSFNLEMLHFVKDFDESINTSYLVTTLIDLESLNKQYINSIGYEYNIIMNNPWVPAMAKEKGLGVYVWTVNDLKAIPSLAGLPLLGIITDIPDKVMLLSNGN